MENKHMLFRRVQAGHGILAAGAFLLLSTVGASAQSWTQNGSTGNYYWSNLNSHIGIGTSSPSYRLDIQSATNYSQLRIRSTALGGEPLLKLSGGYNSGNGAEFWQSGAGDVRVNINSGKVGLIISETGNLGIGIGTGTPSHRFHVGGSAKIQGKLLVDAGTHLSGPETVPTGRLEGGPRIQFNSLRDKWNLPTTNSQQAAMPFFSANWNNGNGIGFIEGDNVASPVVWMYNYGGRNAFTVAKKGFQDNVGDNPSSIDNVLTPLFQVRENGNVGIGTVNPQKKLHVEGDAKVNGTLEVASITTKTWTVAPDYVFEPDYKLASLDEVKSFVKKNKHLPEVPSAKQFKEKGMDLAEMNFILLKKVEELTLHAIRQEERLKEMERKLGGQDAQRPHGRRAH